MNALTASRLVQQSLSYSTLPTLHASPLIMKFLNFQDKVCVMKPAEKKVWVIFKNKQVKFFSDFSVEVQRQKKETNFPILGQFNINKIYNVI